MSEICLCCGHSEDCTLHICDKEKCLVVINLRTKLAEAEKLILEIKAVSCGEEQVQSDGVYDDSDGLKWIYDKIQTFRKEHKDGI